MARQKKAWDDWKKLKFRLLIISKFSSYGALTRVIQENVEFSDDDDLQEPDKGPEPQKWFIIPADSRNKQVWNMFTNIFYMISFFSFPYVIAFNFETMRQMQALEFFVDILMLCDIFTEFITTKEREGEILNKFSDLLVSYLKTTFVFDILACLPGLITLEVNPVYYLFKVFRYLQMPRFFDQLEQIVRKAKSQYVTRAITITNIYLAFKTLFIMLILFHTLASGWIYIGNESGGWRETLLFDHQKDDRQAIYIYAFYFCTTTATTIGYGDITGSLYQEKLFCLLLEFVGILIFSAITGNIRQLKKEPDL